MALRRIRWTTEDEKILREAVEYHNKVLQDIGEAYTGVIRFDEVNYDTIKKSILTRVGFNQKVASLKRLTEENATNIIKTKGGYNISEYHLKEAYLAERRYKYRLQKDLDFYNKPLRTTRRDTKLNVAKKLFERNHISEKEYKDRVKEIKEEFREAPKDERRSRLQRKYPEAILTKSNLEKNFVKDLKNFKVSDSEDTEKIVLDNTYFRDKFERLMNKGNSDYVMYKTIQYKENYMNILESRYSSFDNYDKLYDIVNEMTPEEFYEFMKQDELTEDLTFQSDQHYAQQEFDNFLRRLGVLPSITGTTESVEK